VKIPGDCFNFLGAVVGGLVAGAIAAIVIVAAIIALCTVGGGVYAVSAGLGNNAHAHVVNNPMYESSGAHRDNPLAC
jgi:amino acid transporter